MLIIKEEHVSEWYARFPVDVWEMCLVLLSAGPIIA